MDKNDKMWFTIGFVLLIAMGTWAILDPTAMEKFASAGQWHSGKQMFAEAWGPKLGMVLIAIGALALVGLHQTE